MVCHSLLQEIFLTQGSNLHLLHWKGILYHQATREACACMLSHFSHVRFFVTLWTVAHQAPLSMGFPRQQYWSGLPFPPPGDLPDPGIKSGAPALQVDLLTEPPCVAPHLPRMSPNVTQPWQEPGTPIRLYSHEIHLFSPSR